MTHRKLLKQQTELRQVMMGFDQHDRAMALFFQQHAALHAAAITEAHTWSYADELLQDMAESQIRRIPGRAEHSAAWCLWHIARIEDVTMNRLVAGRPQVLQEEGWLARMKIPRFDTGNSLSADETAHLSATIDIAALRAYRLAVGRRTRQIVRQLRPEGLQRKVDPARVQRLLDEGILLAAASGIADYWRRRTIAGLLLMPATRHNLVHLNEVQKLKGKRP